MMPSLLALVHHSGQCSSAHCIFRSRLSPSKDRHLSFLQQCSSHPDDLRLLGIVGDRAVVVELPNALEWVLFKEGISSCLIDNFLIAGHHNAVRILITMLQARNSPRCW